MGTQSTISPTLWGYPAKIGFDERDGIFVGRVLGLRTIISFHGETVAELRAAFQASLEEYLRDSKERGIRPRKPASGKLRLRVPSAVHGAAIVAARAAGNQMRVIATTPGSARVIGSTMK